MPSIKELVGQLGGDQEAAFRAYKAIEDIVTRASAPENDKERAAAAADLAAELNAKTEPEKDDKGKEKPPRLIHSARVRSKIARLLGYVAADKEVPALVEALDDLDVREMARFALDRSISPKTTEALINALEDQVGPDFRTGVVNALAKRGCARSLAALKKTAESDEDRPVRIAAVEALANFADPSNDALIAKAAKADCPKCRVRANKARMRLAETLCKAGDKSAARKIYKAICASDACPPQKKAAEMALKGGN